MVKPGMAAMAVFAFGASLAASPALADTSGDAAIKALEAKFAAAVSAKDLDGIMKVYVPDESLFVFDVAPPRQYAGAAAYRKDWSAFLAGYKGPIKFTLSDLVVQSAGPVGWGHSIQRVVGVDVNGQPSDVTVRVTDVYRKIDGRWLIVQEHVSVPVDLATGKADLASKP
jgi:ketosteroid isomerase-like protein